MCWKRWPRGWAAWWALRIWCPWVRGGGVSVSGRRQGCVRQVDQRPRTWNGRTQELEDRNILSADGRVAQDGGSGQRLPALSGGLSCSSAESKKQSRPEGGDSRCPQHSIRKPPLHLVMSFQIYFKCRFESLSRHGSTKLGHITRRDLTGYASNGGEFKVIAI
jgi:hypothetical protein